MIPPRPWRVETDSVRLDAIIVADDNTDGLPIDFARLVVRLVNAEPEIVAALEKAYRQHGCRNDVRAAIDRALALLRGDAPAPVRYFAGYRDVTSEALAEDARRHPPRPPADPDAVAALVEALERYTGCECYECVESDCPAWAARAALAKVRP